MDTLSPASEYIAPVHSESQLFGKQCMWQNGWGQKDWVEIKTFVGFSKPEYGLISGHESAGRAEFGYLTIRKNQHEAAPVN